MPKKRKVAIDAKNKQTTFLKGVFSDYLKTIINCHMIGRIISYDRDSHRCDVQPLPLQSDGDKRATLTEVIMPASLYLNDKLTISVGSVVWVGFCDREMDNWNGKSNYTLATKRMHSLQDAVVEAVIES
ncbi:Gp138 family membrane-puncturing spike protein [Lentilactobacillus hilgardii]|uniref:Gp138 family membrane-puncturing spike protein n=1 Tax=Lentilactobacillus hilgardii TaxID=1588 RepID=UPI0021A41461|nr:Gp138 family membrane-puncturing spike protein [Lentilactobacillus hilgardii]MCT3396239.1 hypothetical protein [Lentilactobacillus hilgardii]